MKNIKLILLTGIILSFAGCSKFLDVNNDPNNPSESSVKYVFPAGVENTASVFGGYWLNLGEIWSQHWTSASNAPQYQAEDSYNITAGDYSYDINGWQSLYTRCLTDYEWTKENSKENENWTYYLMAETMQCYTYQVLADFFDQIPLSDALKKHPATFDLGQNVYDTLITRLDTALNKDFEKGDNPRESDVVFGGNIDDWKAFANTLKLKIYLRERFVRPTIAEQGIRKLYTDGVQFLNKDAMFNDFADESGRDNYMYALEFRGGNINMKASNTLLLYLEDKSDPRIDYLFEEGSAGHKGMYQGDFRNVYSGVTNKDQLSSPIVSPVQPVYFISEAESYFLQAEACMLGWGTGNAEDLYKMGINAHYERMGVTENPEDIYTGLGYAVYPNGTQEENLKAIIVQKWLSMANTQGMESFFEHNRTGYPSESSILPGDDDYPDNLVPGEFTVSVTGVLSLPILFPKRLLFPSSEQSTNNNVPPVESLNVPVWWDRYYE